MNVKGCIGSFFSFWPLGRHFADASLLLPEYATESLAWQHDFSQYFTLLRLCRLGAGPSRPPVYRSWFG